jgi:hypothetical protein
MSDRTSQLQNQLKLLYDQLDGLETTKITAPDEEKVRLGQRIDAKWKEIREKDGDYVRSLAQQIKRSDDLPEPFAETIVGELVDELELMEPIAKTDEMRSMLQQILVELQKPGVPAAAKLKVAIPLVPGFVAIELEGDAESVVRRLFPTFLKAYEGVKASLIRENEGK